VLTSQCRLKKRLNLPSIASRPPCPPRVYKKLYDYLASALPDSSTPREPQTPRKDRTSAPASTRTTPKTPLSGRKTPRTAQKIDSSAGEPPEWVMPGIRMLVKKFAYPLATPHVYTGIESTLPLMARMSAAAAETPSKRSKRASNVSNAPLAAMPETKTFALAVVIFLYVLTRMENRDITPEEYEERKGKAMRTMLELPAAKNVTYEELSSEIEDLMHVAIHEGWLQMEWFLNISHVESTDEMEGIEMASNGTTQPAAGRALGLKSGSSDYIGLGTMLQDTTDYLSERQRQDYKAWKAKIMARLEEIEAGA
jgi:origin recognition complex subunit 6